MPMLEKIISGGQTGADRAALDTAIKFNISHGGWVPLGRRAEDGRIPDKYNLQEMPTDSYPLRTEKNILESDGTLIVSRGSLSGGSLLTRKLTDKHRKPCCIINLIEIDEFEAAIMLNNFLADFRIRILNVAGPRRSSDPGIYRSVKGILETVVYMQLIETGADDVHGADLILLERKPDVTPATLADAVAFLAGDMHLRNRSLIANSDTSQIASLYFALADYIKVKLGLDAGNQALVSDCAQHAGVADLDIEDAAMIVLKAVKAHLEKDHVLKVLK